MNCSVYNVSPSNTCLTTMDLPFLNGIMTRKVQDYLSVICCALDYFGREFNTYYNQSRVQNTTDYKIYPANELALTHKSVRFLMGKGVCPYGQRTDHGECTSSQQIHLQTYGTIASTQRSLRVWRFTSMLKELKEIFPELSQHPVSA